ncbi:hypothetical protein CHH28_04880 [Bacterioplanes sanyensis]|uniref:DNA-binding protein n=1 Tax=Bacterioplanes sanyensis TaxID=1249553 RepID=A0A222FHJ8_9GAMM|nr:YheV family putative zinc ribbon protein [Bacterioplanes sanyensis]ASP38056.1 hypothetical protein CHH28_04880 [Bacterioplanes sanyensis]
MKRRFIAGAVCPKCAEMDRVVMFTNGDGDEVRECVACGFSQTSSEQRQQDEQATELATRVTPAGKAVLDEGEQPLRILGGSPKSEKE